MDHFPGYPNLIRTKTIPQPVVTLALSVAFTEPIPALPVAITKPNFRETWEDKMVCTVGTSNQVHGQLRWGNKVCTGDTINQVHGQLIGQEVFGHVTIAHEHTEFSEPWGRVADCWIQGESMGDPISIETPRCLFQATIVHFMQVIGDRLWSFSKRGG